jgi:hypothetical protein
MVSWDAMGPYFVGILALGSYFSGVLVPGLRLELLSVKLAGNQLYHSVYIETC